MENSCVIVVDNISTARVSHLVFGDQDRRMIPLTNLSGPTNERLSMNRLDDMGREYFRG